MRQDNRPELEDNYEKVPRERLVLVNNGVDRLEETRNRRFGAPAVVDQYAEQVERYISPVQTTTAQTTGENVIDFASKNAERLATSTEVQQELMNDQKAV